MRVRKLAETTEKLGLYPTLAHQNEPVENLMNCERVLAGGLSSFIFGTT